MSAAKKIDLAVVLVDIGRESEKVESVAKGILAAIKQDDAKTIEEFNFMVSAAYERNSWSMHLGRPAAGSTEQPAPHAVKLYVSLIRSGYRAGLDVLSFETISAMRIAIRETRNHAQSPVPRPPELKGISVSSENSLNGAIWHDVVVVWEHLPATDKEEFERKVRALLKSFLKKAPPTLAKAA